MPVNPKIREQVNRYLRILLWMLKDAMTQFGKAIVIVVAASVIGVLLQGSVLGIILVYASYIDANTALSLLGWTLEPRTRAAFLGVGAFSMVMLIASALLIYLAKQRIAVLSVDYEEYCSKRVLTLLGGRPRVEIESYDLKSVRRAMFVEQSVHAKGCGRALGTALGGAYPLIVVLYMGMLLAYINLETTLVMLLLFVFFLKAHYQVNVLVVENEGQLLRLQPRSRHDLNRLLTVLMPLNESHSTLSAHVESAYRTGNIEGVFDCLRKRRALVAKADLYSNILIAIAMGTVVIYLGQKALVGGISWGGVIIYLIALRSAVTGARSLLNSAASYARWYPSVRSHYEFTMSSVSGEPPSEADFRLRLLNRSGFGDVSDVSLRRGDAVGIVSPVKLSRYTFFHFIHELLFDKEDSKRVLRGAIDFIPKRPGPPAGVALRRLLNVPPDCGWDLLRSKASGSDFIKRLEEWTAGDLEQEITEQMMLELKVSEIIELCLLSVLLSDRPVLFVSAGALEMLATPDREMWIAKFSDRLLLVHYAKDLDAIGSYGERIVVVGNRLVQRAVATVAWAREHRDSLYLRMKMKRRIRGIGVRMDLDELEAF